MNITNLINQINDPAAKHAMQLIYDELKDKFDNHTHNADGSQVGSYYTSKPRSDAETVTAGTAQTF